MTLEPDNVAHLQLQGAKSRVPRESTTSVVTGLRAGQFPIVPAGTPALPTKIASPVFQRGRNDTLRVMRPASVLTQRGESPLQVYATACNRL